MGGGGREKKGTKDEIKPHDDAGETKRRAGGHDKDDVLSRRRKIEAVAAWRGSICKGLRWEVGGGRRGGDRSVGTDPEQDFPLSAQFTHCFTVAQSPRATLEHNQGWVTECDPATVTAISHESPRR